MPERLRNLQATIADLVLNAHDHEVFRKDPKVFAAQHGLDAKDQAAIAKYQKRFLTYRSLVRFALKDPLPDCFPISKALLTREGAWNDAMDAFLASRSIQSVYYRDINPSFVAWLAESVWGQDRWPFLLPLAHYEYVELEVLRHPDEDLQLSLEEEPRAEWGVVFDGSMRNLAYAYRVHESKEEEPEPVEEPTFLLCFRDREGSFECLELTTHASALLSGLEQGQSIADVTQQVEVDLETAFELLRDLKSQGAILGFMRAEA
jgi:uncharacterized protein